mgnify:CR=1 FL=1
MPRVAQGVLDWADNASVYLRILSGVLVLCALSHQPLHTQQSAEGPRIEVPELELQLMRESDFYTARSYARIVSLTPYDALSASIGLLESRGIRTPSEQEVLLGTLAGGMLVSSAAGWVAPPHLAVILRARLADVQDPMLRAEYIALFGYWGRGGNALAAQEVQSLREALDNGTLNPGYAQSVLSTLLEGMGGLSPDLIYGLSGIVASTDAPELVSFVRRIIEDAR